MLESCIRQIAPWGRVLWLEHEDVEIGVALDFGIRIVHLSCVGMENLFYQQPEDLSDGFFQESGWRLYGGHRLWAAPEGEETYLPDNEPIEWSRTTSAVRLRQPPAGGVEKTICLEFCADGAVQLTQTVRNVGTRVLKRASWGVNTLDGGGTVQVDFAGSPVRDFTPRRTVSLWSDTNLHDPRLYFTHDKLLARHLPSPDYCKLGLYCRPGRAVFQNKGQQLTLTFQAAPPEQHPDGGCNFELYMNDRFLELETLGVCRRLAPGEETGHQETWRLLRL